MSNATHDLTPREYEAVILLARGLNRDKVAQTMCVTPGTLSNMFTSIFSKLGIQSAPQAVAWAWFHGLVQPGEILIPITTAS